MRPITRQSRYRSTDKKAQAKLIMGALFVIGMMLLFWYNLEEYGKEEEKKVLGVKEYLPLPNKGVIYHKPDFSLSYVEDYEIPEWVAYRLTVDMMNAPKTKRYQDFNPDPGIATGSAHYHDYKQSGFRRGHLVPSADMAWNKKSMDATFLLSNIAPMRQEFNDGIWLELEHNVRDWSRLYKNILVITGPVFTDSLTVIGDNKVLVPRYYYKTVFKIENKTPEVIGFLFDQTKTDSSLLENYIVPIDSIEKLTGLDLFSNMYGSWDEEIRLEKQPARTPGQWTMNEKWYMERLRVLDNSSN